MKSKSQKPDNKKADEPSVAGVERRGIQSIERAVSILDVIANNPEGISLVTLSSQLGLNNTTAFHLVKTLVQLGIVDQMPDTKQYRVGSRLFMLAAGALNESTLLYLATPVLERLSRETGEAAHFAVRSRHEIIVIAKTAAVGMLQLSDRSGATRPAHATAIGKVLFSNVLPEDIEKLLMLLSFQRFTPNTITKQDSFLKELEEVRQRGVAYDDCELDEDVKCVAMPVRDFSGRCVGAIGISGPVWRMGPAPLRKKTDQLRKSASELSALLGFVG